MCVNSANSAAGTASSRLDLDSERRLVRQFVGSPARPTTERRLICERTQVSSRTQNCALALHGAQTSGLICLARVCDRLSVCGNQVSGRQLNLRIRLLPSPICWRELTASEKNLSSQLSSVCLGGGPESLAASQPVGRSVRRAPVELFALCLFGIGVRAFNRAAGRLFGGRVCGPSQPVGGSASQRTDPKRPQK